MTVVDPYSIHINGITQLYKKQKNSIFAHSMNDSTRYQLPPCCHNLVEMQLIRLPMTHDFQYPLRMTLILLDVVAHPQRMIVI